MPLLKGVSIHGRQGHEFLRHYCGTDLHAIRYVDQGNSNLDSFIFSLNWFEPVYKCIDLILDHNLIILGTTLRTLFLCGLNRTKFTFIVSCRGVVQLGVLVPGCPS